MEEDAAAIMMDGVPDAEEVVLERTGHMVRFSRPQTFAATIRRPLDRTRTVDETVASLVGTDESKTRWPCTNEYLGRWRCSRSGIH